MGLNGRVKNQTQTSLTSKGHDHSMTEGVFSVMRVHDETRHGQRYLPGRKQRAQY